MARKQRHLRGQSNSPLKVARAMAARQCLDRRLARRRGLTLLLAGVLGLLAMVQLEAGMGQGERVETAILGQRQRVEMGIRTTC